MIAATVTYSMTRVPPTASIASAKPLSSTSSLSFGRRLMPPAVETCSSQASRSTVDRHLNSSRSIAPNAPAVRRP